MVGQLVEVRDGGEEDVGRGGDGDELSGADGGVDGKQRVGIVSDWDDLETSCQHLDFFGFSPLNFVVAMPSHHVSQYEQDLLVRLLVRHALAVSSFREQECGRGRRADAGTQHQPVKLLHFWGPSGDQLE